MKDLTKNKPKCLVKITKEECILSWQLKLLKQKGIKDIIITTGPYKEQIESLIDRYFSDMNVMFVNNRYYESTNYIYSLYLIKDMIKDDIILLHGDLVFDKNILERLLNTDKKNVVLINKANKSPSKDFKAIIKNKRIEKIGVTLNNEFCYLLQPLYKFKRKYFKLWLIEIVKFVEKGFVNVYAETVLNTLLLEQIKLEEIEFTQELCMEIDNKQDLKKVKQIIRGCKL